MRSSNVTTRAARPERGRGPVHRPGDVVHVERGDASRTVGPGRVPRSRVLDRVAVPTRSTAFFTLIARSRRHHRLGAAGPIERSRSVASPTERGTPRRGSRHPFTSRHRELGHALGEGSTAGRSRRIAHVGRVHGEHRGVQTEARLAHLPLRPHRGARAQVPEHPSSAAGDCRTSCTAQNRAWWAPSGQIGVLPADSTRRRSSTPPRSPARVDGQHVGRRVDATIVPPARCVPERRKHSRCRSRLEHDVTAFERQQVDDPAAVAREGPCESYWAASRP